MEKQIIQILFYDTQRGWVKDTLEKSEKDQQDTLEDPVYLEE